MANWRLLTSDFPRSGASVRTTPIMCQQGGIAPLKSCFAKRIMRRRSIFSLPDASSPSFSRAILWFQELLKLTCYIAFHVLSAAYLPNGRKASTWRPESDLPTYLGASSSLTKTRSWRICRTQCQLPPRTHLTWSAEWFLGTQKIGHPQLNVWSIRSSDSRKSSLAGRM